MDLPKDAVTRAVIQDLTHRANVGLQKYGTTLADNNSDDFLQHMYEELLDAAQYIKKEMLTRDTIQELVASYPIYDAELGRVVRSIFSGKKQ